MFVERLSSGVLQKITKLALAGGKTRQPTEINSRQWPNHAGGELFAARRMLIGFPTPARLVD
jgi:hypothetical protein